MSGRRRRAVLLMAYGGPERLEDVEPFLADVRGGRATPPELVEEIRQRYAAIGGGSPLLAVSRRQAAALERVLRADETEGTEWRCFVGMRHWHPYVRRAVAEIAAAGFDRLVALCLAPHYSRMSVGAYHRALDAALATEAAGGRRLEAVRVAGWGDEPRFLDAVAVRVVAALDRWPAAERGAVHVLYTAHSLPARIVAEGDPYDSELRASAAAVAARVAARLDQAQAPSWGFCYQSQAAGARDWLGPPLEAEIARLAAAGVRHLLVAPIGFVADHVEVLYDLDVEARAQAAAAGVRLERTASLNDDADFAAALAAVVRRAAAAF